MKTPGRPIIEQEKPKPSEQLRRLLRHALHEQLTPRLVAELTYKLRALIGPGLSLVPQLNGSVVLDLPCDAPPLLREAVEAAMAPPEPPPFEEPILRWRCIECGRVAPEPPENWRSGPGEGKTFCQGDSRQGAHRGHKPSGGPQMTVVYLLDDRDLLGSLAFTLGEEPVEIVGRRWHEEAKRAVAGDEEARQSLLAAYPWAAPQDPWQMSHALTEENLQLRAALRHVMYAITSRPYFAREDFGVRNDEYTAVCSPASPLESARISYIPALAEAHNLLKRLGEHDSSVADQADAWLPPNKLKDPIE